MTIIRDKAAVRTLGAEGLDGLVGRKLVFGGLFADLVFAIVLLPLKVAGRLATHLIWDQRIGSRRRGVAHICGT